MCGIIGYVGKNTATDLLLSGLESLEYRGYDSAGIAVISDNEICIRKEKGNLSKLKEKLFQSPVKSNIGIGHTRWATHGIPSVENSHPHTNESETIAVVHNGIIENYEEIKALLLEKGYSFKSETDTEVIPHLIDFYYEGDLMGALKKTVDNLIGSYAIGVISSHEPNKILAVKNDSPLVVGIGKGENYIASDIPAILSKTKDIYLLGDNEFVTLTEKEITITDYAGNLIKKDIYKANFSSQDSQKSGYKHFMLKEIYEQPDAIRNTLRGRIDENLNLKLDEIKFSDKIDKIFIVACGTAYHAGLVGKKAIETLSKIQCEVCLASEFRYNNPLLNDRTAVMVVSQSGETADTLGALRLAKKEGNTVYAITNVLGSSIAREADYVFYTHAGPEISVASTKAYTSQLVAFYLIAIHLAECKNNCIKEKLDKLKYQLIKIPDAINDTFKLEESIKLLAKRISKERDIYFLGRSLDYFIAQEASLKLKEISYIHSDAYASGELKHGPIALIEDNTVVISVCTNPDISSKLFSNVKEVSARGAYTVGVTSCNSTPETFDFVIELPKVDPLLAPLPAIIPFQLLAYYVCTEKGYDVDKPRNLAKSVTVE